MKVFISHSVLGDSAAEALAHELFDALEDRNFEPFLDLERLRVGDDWEAALRDEIDRADAAILLLSPKAIEESEWVAREIHLLRVREGRRPGFVLLPLFLGGVRPSAFGTGRLAPFDLGRRQGVDVAATPDWLDRVLQRLDGARRGVLESYVAAVQAFCDRLPYESDTASALGLRVSDVYVPQRVEEERPGTAGEIDEAHGSAQRSFGVDGIAHQSSDVVIVGGPGTGKSTLLRHLALAVIEEWRSGGSGALLPVWVSARTLAPRRVSFAEGLRLDVEEGLGRLLDVTLPEGFFQHPPSTRARWLVLVDALDEIVDVRQRNELITDLRSVAMRPDAPYRFVTTTRPIQTDLFGPGFELYQLLPLTYREVGAFARAWFGAQYDLAEAFLAKLEASRLHDLISNALLLTIAAIVYRHGAEAFGSRAALYREFVATMLDREQGRDMRSQIREQWEEARGTEGLETADRLFNNRRAILEHLAEYVRGGGVGRLDAEALSLSRARGWIAADEDAGALKRLGDLLARTGLVTDRDDRQAFIHPTFADYLVAARLDAEAGDGSVAGGILDGWQDEARRDVVLFLLGIRSERGLNADAQLSRIARSDEGVRFCGVALAEGVRVAPELERQLVDNLLCQTRDMGLVELWRHPNAVEVLGLLRAREQVRAGLVALARGDEMYEGVRDRTADALARLGCVEDLRALSADRQVAMKVRVRAAEHLGRHEPIAGKPMLEAAALNAGVDGYVRMDSATALWRLGLERSAQSAVLFLALDPEFLENEYWRVGSARLLGALGRREEAIELLFRALHEPRLVVSPGMATEDLVPGLVELGAGRALLEARADAAEPDKITEELVRGLYLNEDDELGATVLAEILAAARQSGLETVNPAWLFPRVVDERSLARIAVDESVDARFREACAAYLSHVGFREPEEDEPILPGLIRLPQAPVHVRIAWRVVGMLRGIGLAARRAGLAIRSAGARSIGIVARRRYLRHLSRVAANRRASEGQRIRAIDRILEAGPDHADTWIESLRAVGGDPAVSGFIRAFCAESLFEVGHDEDALAVLATGPLYLRDSEYFFERLANSERKEGAAALATSMLRDERMSSQLQAGAVASLRSPTDSSLLEHLARDGTIKPWLRILAVRELSQEHPGLLLPLARDEALELWPRLEAVDRMGRAGREDDLWSVAYTRGLDPRAQRLAVWWLARLADGDDARLSSLAETEPDARVRTAIEDARVMVGMRAAESSLVL